MTKTNDLPWDPRWLSRLSHDLRNELMPLRTATDLLGADKLPPETQREMVKMIDRQARRLVAMLDDVSEYGHALASSFRSPNEVVDLAVVIDGAISQIESEAQAKGIDLSLELLADAVEVRGDAGRLTLLLRRLLQNAIHFTPDQGAVRLQLSEDGRYAHLWVADGGPGIAPDQRESVFEPPTHRSESGGLAISLMLARKCARDHGGDLVVAASPDPDLGGAMLQLSLPLWTEAQSVGKGSAV